MYRRESPEPNERNREIYEAVAHDGRKQKDVAQAYGLSQPMISKIVSQYEEWIVAHAPNENLAPHEREFVAANTWCELLTRGKRMALDGYEASCQDRLLKPEEGVRGRWIPAKRDMKCVQTLTDCAEKFLTATKARESARHLLISARDRDPQYQAEQARLSREACERRVAEQKRKDREAAAQRERENAAITVRHDETPGMTTPGSDAKPDPRSSDVRLAARADDIRAMPESTPLTNAAQAVINLVVAPEISSGKGDSKRLYEIATSQTLGAELLPSRPQPARPVGESVGELENGVGERDHSSVVVALRRDDITGETAPASDAKPDLGSGDVRTQERADDIQEPIYWARERKAPPGYAPVDVTEWHGLEPPEDAILKWRHDYPKLAPMVCNGSGELINCVYLCDVVDPEQAERDRAAGIKPEQLYCWLSSREINARSRDELLAYARRLWRERGYSRRGVGSLSREQTSHSAAPVSRKTADALNAAPGAAPATRDDRMTKDRRMPEGEQNASLRTADSSPENNSPANRRGHRRINRRARTLKPPRPLQLDYHALEQAAERKFSAQAKAGQ